MTAVKRDPLTVRSEVAILREAERQSGCFHHLAVYRNLSRTDADVTPSEVWRVLISSGHYEQDRATYLFRRIGEADAARRR